MGGSKVFAQKAASSGEDHRCHTRPRSNGNAADATFSVGGSNPVSQLLAVVPAPFSPDRGRDRQP